jgi:outer membrane lipoprotein-sorting protein
MRLTTLLGLVLLLSRLVPAQTSPGVAEILRSISETYEGVPEYELVAEQTVKLPGNAAPTRAHTRVAFRAPNQYRLEGTIPGLMDNDSNSDETVLVHDGAALWFYLPKSNEYTSMTADQLARDPEASAHTPQATDRIALQKYRVAADFIDGARLLNEEDIEIGTSKRACYVVSVPERWPGPYKWWVDKKTHRVLREDTSDGTTVYTTIRLGARLPDNLFKFEPPPGARRLDPH